MTGQLIDNGGSLVEVILHPTTIQPIATTSVPIPTNTVCSSTDSNSVVGGVMAAILVIVIIISIVAVTVSFLYSKHLNKVATHKSSIVISNNVTETKFDTETELDDYTPMAPAYITVNSEKTEYPHEYDVTTLEATSSHDDTDVYENVCVNPP